jgi:hypothetical protein
MPREQNIYATKVSGGYLTLDVHLICIRRISRVDRNRKVLTWELCTRFPKWEGAHVSRSSSKTIATREENIV